MIPLTRSRVTRRMETTLVSYSRQSLPRPARYATSSKRVHAPALATAPAPAADSFPAFMHSPQHPGLDSQADYNEMEGFLRRRTPYTILPTPLPSDQSGTLNDFYFTDSPTQDLLSVMDACLHNLYDVPRAKGIFERLRQSEKGDIILDARVYNSLLYAYLAMVASSQDLPAQAGIWLEDFWQLFGEVESQPGNVRPTANTYAVALLAWQRYHPQSPAVQQPVMAPNAREPAAILRSMVDRSIPATLVVSDRAFTTSDEASQAIQALSKAAVQMGLSKIVGELGMADSLGRLGDVLDNVPEVNPVMRPKKQEENIQVTLAENGSIMDVDVITEGETEEPEYEIPFNLDTLRKHLSQVVLARRVLPNDVAARQKLLEESVYDVAVERLKHQSELIEDLGLGNKALLNVDLRTWMWNWHLKLQVRLKAEIDALQEEERRIPTGSGRRLDPYRASALGPFLSLLKPEKLSLIAILELMHLQGTGGVIDGMKTARALLAVGKAVELEYKAEMCKKHNVAIPTSTGRPNERGYFTALAYRELHNHRIAAQKYLEDAEDWTSDWTQAVRVKIGSFLVDALMDVATVVRTAVDKKTGEVVTEEQPAFFHSYEYIRGYKLGVIKLNPEIAEKMAKESLRETLHPRHLPMLVKPKPWLNYDQGGYLFNRTYAMRFKDSQEQQNYLRHAAQMGNLELIFAGLDVLGSTPWQINRSVFDVVLEVWNSGVRWEKIPPAVYDVAEPGKPENHETEPKARVYYMMRMKNWQLQKAANHSDRCSVNYKIEIARAFLGDTIYFPHNVDFRGRAYPLPPHLSHIGDDLSRGLLKFGEAKRLGERGLRWLKIHLANLYGFDKANFDERVAFVDRQLDNIFDSATNPINGRRWWTKADDPWQCLATCMELKAALESPNPYDYECALPVHQDGTCNGLQHYAALGGDAQGAKQVNLDVTERPADVYTYVANMVEQSMIEDREKGDYFATLLSGKIARKVVKQTVMTTVYGVTYIGAREQIEKQLKDRGDIPAEECWGASAYVAKKVLGCIGDLFHGAKEIQNWLSVTARLISKSIPPERLEATENSGEQSSSVESSDAQSSSIRFINKSTLKKEQMTSVIWTTPLGLPIVQPYRATKRKQIITSLQTVYISDPSSPTIVNSQKQASAFPPNFIHSLDATHMMLTALECQTRGLTFASVHDSYWTHAGSIDDMSAIIRETFIALHSSDVLGKLAEEFRERYKGYKIPLTSINSAKLIRSLGLCLDSEIVAHNLDGTPAGTVPLSEVIRSNDDDADELADADEAEDEMSAAESEEGATESEEGAAKSKKGAAKSKKGKKKQLKNIFRESGFEGKFVELVDILPPLPKKGQFDVATIKKSLYFFS